jgi:hypothetical protein
MTNERLNKAAIARRPRHRALSPKMFTARLLASLLAILVILSATIFAETASAEELKCVFATGENAFFLINTVTGTFSTTIAYAPYRKTRAIESTLLEYVFSAPIMGARSPGDMPKHADADVAAMSGMIRIDRRSYDFVFTYLNKRFSGHCALAESKQRNE